MRKLGKWGQGVLILSVWMGLGSSGWARSRVLPTLEPGPDDQASDLPGTRLRFLTLESMEQARLMSGRLPESPWSGDYWPIYQGIIARRYQDSGFPGRDWKSAFLWAKREVGSGRCAVDQLSPAEKYDLLVGDRQFTLTRQMWSEGVRYQDAQGEVEPWMGICEGWAAASIRVPRPLHTVTVIAADGKTRIPFNPDDIKALNSLLWSRGRVEKALIGGRCNEKSTPTDSSGRPTRPECLDTNPATWHLSVVHRIGAGREGLVMDANSEYEVWNHPIYSYIYSYSHPVTGQEVVKLSDAVVARAAWPQDPYARYRSRQAESVVGVKMTVDYLSEIAASDADRDDPMRDLHRRMTYTYDLELDREGRIVGGEWHSKVHPDFLWAPVAGKPARSEGDVYLDGAGNHSSWDGMRQVPIAWRKVAPAASRLGQPLERIVSMLSVLSRLGTN